MEVLSPEFEFELQNLHLRPEVLARDLQLSLVGGLVGNGSLGIALGDPIPEPARLLHRHLHWLDRNVAQTRGGPHRRKGLSVSTIDWSRRGKGREFFATAD